MKQLLIIILLFGLTTLNAQHWCGTDHNDNAALVERMIKNRDAVRNGDISPPTATMYVPLTIHLTAKSDGSGRFDDYKDLVEMVCKINDHFADLEMQFYLKEVTQDFNNTTAYENPGSSFGRSIIRNKKIRYPKTINLFITKSADRGQGGGTVLAYYDREDDYIVSNMEQISAARAHIIAHELGHFFTLAHTFFGWENGPPDFSKPTPTITPSGQTTEYVSRTKTGNGGRKICEYAADGFCDTPADYNLGFGHNGCDYQGAAKDPDGVALDPGEDNFMGYFLSCLNVFSDEQQAAILVDYNSNKRTHLRDPYTPLADVGDVEYLYPANNQTVPFDQILFDWNDVPNATHYVLQIANNITFAQIFHQTLVDESQYLHTTLEKNKNYAWRVLAYNATDVCLETSRSRFSTSGNGTATRNLDEDNVQLIPIFAGETQLLKVLSDHSFQGQIQIMREDGKTIDLHRQDIRSGITDYYLNETLTPGLYIALLWNENRLLSKRKFQITH